MSLYRDIVKATSLKWDNDDAKFVRLQGLSQAAKDRKMNERKVKKPRNIHLLEDNDNDDSDDDNDCYNNFMHDKTKPFFDKHAISAAIKEVNGGLDLSNKHLERYYFEHLQNITEKEKSQNFPSRCNDLYFENQSENLDNKNVLDVQMHKLRKNAAIMGIANIRKISLEDLISSSNKNFTEEKNKLEVLCKASTSDLGDNDDDNNDCYIQSVPHDNFSYVQSVPHDDEGEVFIHPLQKGIDVTKYKNMDFTLPRIGKRTKITPKTYFLNTIDNTCFDFKEKKEQHN